MAIKEKGMIKVPYYDKITKMSNSDLIDLFHTKNKMICNEFETILNSNLYDKLLKDLISAIYFMNPEQINYQLQMIQKYSYRNKYKSVCNCIKCYTTRRKFLMLILISKDFIYSWYTSLIDYAELIGSSILIYYQFIFIKKQIISKIKEKYNPLIIYNENSFENNDIIEKNIEALIKGSIKNDTQKYEELYREIKNTSYGDIYNNDIIVKYICNIISKLFPNCKNIKSHTYFYAQEFTDVSTLLSLNTKKSHKNKKIIKEIEEQFKKGYSQYLNHPIIKENFHNPILEINKRKHSINYLFHKIILRSICYKNHKKTGSKVHKIVSSIYQKIEEYKQLLNTLKQNNNSICNKTMIIFHRYNIDLYKIRPLFTTEEQKVLKCKFQIHPRSSFVGYFIMIYQLTKKYLSIPMDHTVYSHQKTISCDTKLKMTDIELYQDITKFYNDKIKQRIVINYNQ